MSSLGAFAMAIAHLRRRVGAGHTSTHLTARVPTPPEVLRPARVGVGETS